MDGALGNAKPPVAQAFEFDPKTFEMVKAERFEDKALIDRIVGIGVAAHEGQLFGWFNQLLGLVTAMGYMVLVVTSALMWWRRRPRGALGAPPALAERRRLGPIMIGLIVVLGVFLPTLGISLLAVLAAEGLLRRFAPRTAAWLGLTSASRDKEGFSAA